MDRLVVWGTAVAFCWFLASCGARLLGVDL